MVSIRMCWSICSWNLKLYMVTIFSLYISAISHCSDFFSWYDTVSNLDGIGIEMAITWKYCFSIREGMFYCYSVSISPLSSCKPDLTIIHCVDRCSFYWNDIYSWMSSRSGNTSVVIRCSPNYRYYQITYSYCLWIDSSVFIDIDLTIIRKFVPMQAFFTSWKKRLHSLLYRKLPS